MAEGNEQSREEVEIHWLRAIVLPETLRDGKLVPNYDDSKLETFRILNIEIKFLEVKEAFMLTLCYRATIDYLYDGIRRTLNLVVKKTPPVPDAMYEAICFTELFRNEIYTYTTLIPAIEDFTNSSMNFAKFFYSELQPGFATVALHDFGADDWQMSRNSYNLSFDHLIIAVKFLGTFHGIGFAMKSVDPQKFANLMSVLEEARFRHRNENRQYKLMVKTSIERCQEKVREYQPQLPDEFLNKFHYLSTDFYEYGRQLITEPKEPMSTLCHGDFLRNNIAFKYEYLQNNREVPIEMLMFDLQTMRVASPMLDLVILLCLSAFTETRSAHFEQIYNCYYKELTTAYEQYSNNETPEFLSHENLLKEYTRFMPYGTLVACSFLQMLMVPLDVEPENLLKAEDTDEEIISDAKTRGGEVLDREISHQIKEIYELSRRHNVDICEGINL